MQPPRLRKIDLFWTLIPAILWLISVQLRPHVIQTTCAAQPSPCTIESVLPVDQPGLKLENGPADGYSYFTQNTAGVLAVAAPLALNTGMLIVGRLHPAAALATIGTDLVIFAQTSFWNGTLNELTRLIVQRPRPFVYGDPSRAPDPHNYTSFYSGHTSFTATAVTCMILLLVARGAPFLVMLAALITGQSLVIATAAYRILSGRHFLTDTLAGAAMGLLVAILVAYFHQPASIRHAIWKGRRQS